MALAYLLGDRDLYLLSVPYLRDEFTLSLLLLLRTCPSVHWQAKKRARENRFSQGMYVGDEMGLAKAEQAAHGSSLQWPR